MTPDWVSPWPWTSDGVQACIAPGGGNTEIIEFSALSGEGDDAFTSRIVEELQRLAWPNMSRQVRISPQRRRRLSVKPW